MQPTQYQILQKNFVNMSTRYNNQAKESILNPKNIGSLTEIEGHLLVCGKSGSYYFGSVIFLQAIVKISSGNIEDIKYRMFGTTIDILTYETMSEFIKGKNHSQIKRISTRLAEKVLKNKTNINANNSIQLFLDAINSAMTCCEGLNESNTTPLDTSIKEDIVNNWEALNNDEKIIIINNVINTHITSFVEMDGGTVVVESFSKDVLYISLKGQCEQCPASYGSTIEAIKFIIKNKTSQSLQVFLSNNTLQKV